MVLLFIVRLALYCIQIVPFHVAWGERARRPEGMGGARVPQYKRGPRRLASHSSLWSNIGPMSISSQSEQLRDKHLIDMDQIRKKLGDENLFDM